MGSKHSKAMKEAEVIKELCTDHTIDTKGGATRRSEQVQYDTTCVQNLYAKK